MRLPINVCTSLIETKEKCEIFQAMGMAEMASMLTQQQMGNDSGDGEPILPPHPDQTDTIDGESTCYETLVVAKHEGVKLLTV